MNWEAIGGDRRNRRCSCCFRDTLLFSCSDKNKNQQLEKSNDHARAQTSVHINDQALSVFENLMSRQGINEKYTANWG